MAKVLLIEGWENMIVHLDMSVAGPRYVLGPLSCSAPRISSLYSTTLLPSVHDEYEWEVAQRGAEEGIPQALFEKKQQWQLTTEQDVGESEEGLWKLVRQEVEHQQALEARLQDALVFEETRMSPSLHLQRAYNRRGREEQQNLHELLQWEADQQEVLEAHLQDALLPSNTSARIVESQLANKQERSWSCGTHNEQKKKRRQEQEEQECEDPQVWGDAGGIQWLTNAAAVLRNQLDWD
jgi:hypothetical protein